MEQAAYAENDAAINQPASVLADEGAEPLPTPPVEEPASGGLTIDGLEQLALMNNPSVGQASAQCAAFRENTCRSAYRPILRWDTSPVKWATKVTGGQQGAFAGQDFIGGGKLEKNRSIVAAEIDKAEQALAAIRTRVTTDVRTNYYRALVAQATCGNGHIRRETDRGRGEVVGRTLGG